MNISPDEVRICRFFAESDLLRRLYRLILFVRIYYVEVSLQYRTIFFHKQFQECRMAFFLLDRNLGRYSTGEKISVFRALIGKFVVVNRCCSARSKAARSLTSSYTSIQSSGSSTFSCNCPFMPVKLVKVTCIASTCSRNFTAA